MAETSYKIGRRKGFTVVYRSVAQDNRLSLKARGLFLLMQSLPDDWTLTQSGLASFAGVGRDQIRAALKELETVGYLIAEQSHDGGGRFAKTNYVLQEESPRPLSENPTTVSPENQPLSGKPSTENPSSENPALQNTIDTNTPLPPTGECACDSGKTSPDSAPKWKPERFARFWDFYRANSSGRRVGSRRAAARAWDKLQLSDDAINLMGFALQRQVKDDMWRRGVGVPYVSTWLNQRRWEDDAPAPDTLPPVDLQEVSGWKT